MSELSSDGIKPCPFCGRQPSTFWQDESDVDRKQAAVECCHCGCFGPTAYTKGCVLDAEPEAIRLWNKRAVPAPEEHTKERQPPQTGEGS